MTRDEAIKAWETEEGNHPIDRLVALGVLKLDEPKDAEQRAVEVLNRNLGPYTSAAGLIGALSLAGLKIVEK